MTPTPMQRTRGEVADAERLGEHEWRKERTGEGCDGEHGGFACGAEAAEREGVEVDAEPVADGTERERGGEHGRSGKVFADDECEHDVDGAGDARLDAHDGTRVAHGEGLGEIVVEGPAGAGSSDEQDADPVGLGVAGSEPEQDRTGEDHEGAGHGLAGEMFAEQRDADDDGERSLEVQQQRTGDAGDAFEAEEQ